MSPFVRNLLILAAVALVIVVLNLETALVTAGMLLRVAFIIAIAVVAYFYWRDFGRREISTWPPRAAYVFYAAVGLLIVDIGWWLLAGLAGRDLLARAVRRRGVHLRGLSHVARPEHVRVTGRELVESHVRAFNDGVRTGDWEPMLARFADDAELRFENVPAGPFGGLDEIRHAYREQPPDDEIRLLGIQDDVDAPRHGGVRLGARRHRAARARARARRDHAPSCDLRRVTPTPSRRSSASRIVMCCPTKIGVSRSV